MRIAVVGATGMVGGVMIEVLKEHNLPFDEIFFVASERSAGKSIAFDGVQHTIIGMQAAVDKQVDIALFSAGGDTSLEWAPKFAASGATVIDNSSAFRMNEAHKLIVPEINASLLTAEDKIIANPNCSTIQMVLALKPLHDAFGVKRVVVSTYQSITGTGVKAKKQLMDERAGQAGEKVYPHAIDLNCIPHCDVFLDNDYTKEEMKMVHETKKILDPKINLTATAVRVPVMGGHSEALNIEFETDFTLEKVKSLLSNFEGITLQDNPDENLYPMPALAANKDDVFVGRIRRDESQKNTLNMWVVSDNLRKGAATNAVQIAEYLIKNKLI